VKGVELPINILVVVAIAVIVLLGLVALYFIGYNPFAGTAGLEGIKNDACRQYVQGHNCGQDATNVTGILVSNYDANGDGAIVGGTTFGAWGAGTNCGTTATTSEDNLASICQCQYGRGTEADCRKLCGCP